MQVTARSRLLLSLGRSRPKISAVTDAAVSPGHHVNALTGVRAFAALWVFLFHSWLNSGAPTVQSPGTWSVNVTPLFKFGWLGLDIFFVLSGFLLTWQAWSFSNRSQQAVTTTSGRSFGEQYVDFLRRRILRVYPAYYACLTVLLVLAAMQVYLRMPGTAELMLHLGMFHNLIEKYIATMNGAFWTLPFEWQFYLGFPLMFILLRRQGVGALFAAACAIAVTTKLLVVATNNGYVQVLPFIRLDEFAAGMCAATIAQRTRLGAAAAGGAFALGIIGLFSIPWVFASYPNIGGYFDLVGFLRPLWLEAAICLLLLGLTGAHHWGVSLFDNRVAVGLGLVSYSIYLFHVPIIELLPALRLAPHENRTLSQVVIGAFPVIVFVSATSYWLVERPFQSAGRARAGESVLDHLSSWLARIGPVRVLVIWALVLVLFHVGV